MSLAGPMVIRQRFQRTLASLLCLVSGLFAADCRTRPPLHLDAADHWHSLQHQAQSRRFLVHKPESWRPGQPIWYVLHGGGGKPENMIQLTEGRINLLADQHGILVVYPAGIHGWNDGRTFADDRERYKIDDTGFIQAIQEWLVDNYQAGSAPVFAAGISNGGFMAQRLACEMPAIRAVASVTATLSVELKPICKPKRPVGVLFINGTADPLVPYNGGFVTVKIIRTRQRGQILSTDQSIDFWRDQNRCTQKTAAMPIPDLDPDDGTTASHTIWSRCQAGATVELIAVQNGGHTWPGGWQYLPESMIGKTSRDFRASDMILKFFSKYL
ncbi:MAG: hypothetical protein KDK39_10740 [Leptospiraceae bacterium]|nr:hypothetical protein [Leptospiraceae bacterium]